MVRTGAKTWLKSCISKPVFLTAQQNSASTLHRKLEEEEGFGTESGLQVPGWKRLDKILHCKQYNKLYSFLQAIVPMALFLFLIPFFIIYIFFTTSFFVGYRNALILLLCWKHELPWQPLPGEVVPQGPKAELQLRGLTWGRTETRAPWALSLSRKRICRKFGQ